MCLYSLTSMTTNSSTKEKKRVILERFCPLKNEIMRSPELKMGECQGADSSVERK